MARATWRLGTCAVERAVAGQYMQARAMFASACRSPQAGPLVRASALRMKRRAGRSHSTMPSGATQQIARQAPALRVCTKTSLHKQCLEASFGATKTSPRKQRFGASFERSGQYAHLRCCAPRLRIPIRPSSRGRPVALPEGPRRGSGSGGDAGRPQWAPLIPLRGRIPASGALLRPARASCI